MIFRKVHLSYFSGIYLLILEQLFVIKLISYLYSLKLIEYEADLHAPFTIDFIWTD